jgi:DNA (cytosine-5)-methyltransferase 1
VIDFFCGAGGFSEGFRQQGFDIIGGIDNWQPAIDTHNLNHNLNDTIFDILNYWSEESSNIEEINKIPNTEFIIGSPSCISFSMSNNAGKADKTLGIKLIEAYLRVIAVKKHQKNSILKAWYMENVPKSKNFIKEEYTFKDLSLSKWAKKNNKNPEAVALKTHGGIFNAGDYGAPQERKRFIAGEWTENGEFIFPKKTHECHVKSCDIRNKMPKPSLKKNTKKWIDPNYPNLELKTEEITDHFYDTGLYEIEWEKAEHLKINHPFMGKMYFPENENRPCRTIMATRSASTRESIIYKSEHNRKGNGEYRLPTIREIASLMGFPYVYQFTGSEIVKWRQVGNSVCPHMSSALAKALRKKMNLPEIQLKNIKFSPLKDYKIINLNTFIERKFNNPKKRQINARFRRHPLKAGNMTVDLMNYHPNKKDCVAENWYISVFFGTGDGHGFKILQDKDLEKIKKYLKIISQNLLLLKAI